MTNEERRGTRCFEFQLQRPLEREAFHVSWGVVGLGYGDGASHKGQCGRGGQVTGNRLKSLHCQKGETNLPLLRQMNTNQLLSCSSFFLSWEVCSFSTEGWQGEREWRGPLLRRVGYLMKGNQLERYSGLWTFIHLAWPLLNFHDGLWLFRGRDQS